jgi:DNA-binding NtrC family response regulator
VMERALILSQNKDEIEPEHIQFAQVARASGPLSTMTLEEMEKLTLTEALEKNRWRKQQTAEKLGIAKSTLNEKIKKYGIRDLLAG